MTHCSCETVTGRTMAELLAARDAATRADMVELRLDGVRDVDVARRAERPARAGHRDLPRRRGKAAASTAAKSERRAILLEALDAGAEYVDVEWRAGLRPTSSRAIRRARSSCRRTTFDGVPADLRAARAAMRQTGAGDDQDRGVAATRLSDDAAAARRSAQEGDAVVIGDGRRRRAVAAARGALRIALDVRGRRGGAGTDSGGADARRVPVSARSAPARAIYGVVGNNVMHSLSPVMHNAAFDAAGHRRGLRAAAGAPTSTTSWRSPTRWASRAPASRFRSSSTRSRGRSMPTTLTRAGRRGQHAAARRGDGLGSDQHRRRRVSSQPLDAAYRRDRCRARVRPSSARAARRAPSSVALASRGARVTVHARRREQAQRASRRAAASDVGRVAAGRRVVGSARQLHAARRRRPRAASRRCPAGRSTGALVYDLTYGDGETPLLRDARAAGLPDARRAADARRAGRAAVRMVDGAAARAGVMEAARASGACDSGRLNGGLTAH